MTILSILQYPNPQLRRHGISVQDFGDKFQKVVDDMFETHYIQQNCAALAATQLNLPNAPHVTVIDFSSTKDQPLCLVNAKIVDKEGEAYEPESCMSVSGGIYEPISRAYKIQVESLDRYGKVQNFEAEGFLAKCIQHELDHLKGVLFIDYLSSFKRQRAEKKLAHLKKKRRIGG